MHLSDFSWHDGEVLNTRVVREPESMPYDNVLISHTITGLKPRLDAGTPK